MSRKPDKIIETKMEDTEKQNIKEVDKEKEIKKVSLDKEIGSKELQAILSTAYQEALDGRR